MKLARVLCMLSLAALVVAGPFSYSQANVVENQTTFLYVDAQTGSDSNSGSSAAPLKTIQAAVNKANTNNQKSVGTKIVVNAGIYREMVNVNPITGQTTAPLTIEAATTGKVIVAASDVLTGWSTDPQFSGAYVANWAPVQSTCPLPGGWPAVQPIALHTEMLFVNSIPMTQVLAYADIKPGTFFVDTTTGTVHVWPPLGVDFPAATIEVATRSKTISVYGRTNIVLRGLVFEHAASCINTSGATVTGSNNVLIDSIQANWNNFGGLGIFSSANVTVKNSVGSYNGGVGFQGAKDQATLYSNNETDYNNWRGAQAAFYNWAMGGTKLFQMRTTTVQNHFSYNNQAQGLWFDTDNQNITINNVTLAGNYHAALQVERNKGPILLENSRLCSSGVGMNVLTTEGLTVNNNVFYNNGATNKYQAQFYLAGTAGGINITDWQTGQVYDLFTTGTVISGNAFIDQLSGQYVFGTYLSGTDWTDFTSTLKSGNNTWYDPNTTAAFRIVNGKNVDLAGWQAATGQDYSSTWAAPATSPVSACAVPSASYPDFNVALDNGSYTMASGVATAAVRVNSFNFGTVNLSVSGLPAGVTASFSAPSLTSGSSTLTFTASSTTSTQTVPVTLWAIGGDRVHSVSFSLAVNANPASVATTTTLTSSASTITEGSSVTLTAIVRPAGGATVPTGNITFYNSGSSIGTAPLSSGTATLSTSALPIGSNSITAEYAGSSTFQGSTSSVITINVSPAVVGTTTVLTASSTSIAQNSPVTFTATVKPASGTSTPSGVVTFYNGSAALGSISLSGGVASISTSALPVGTDPITAVYSGSGSFNSSTSNAVEITVNAAVVDTTTLLRSSASSIAQNSPVTLTATVTASNGTMTPTGTVTFYNGATALGSASLSSGVAGITTSALPIGNNSVTAAYSGAVTFNASSSNIVAITVNAATVDTSTRLTVSSLSITQNTSVTLTATVKQSTGTSTPTGTVDFYSGTSLLGTASLTAGIATLSTSALPVGSDSITAAYVGNSAFNPSSSAAIVVTVVPALISTSTTLTASSTSIKQNASVTFAATVKPGNGTSVPTGTVIFYSGSTSIGSSPLSGGTASLSTSALPVGSQSITAMYGGSSSFRASTSNAVTVKVTSTLGASRKATSTTLISSSTQADQGFTISLIAAVSAIGDTTIPTGEVGFYIGDKQIGTASLTNGRAYLNTASLPVGDSTITASYLGDADFAPSTSTAITVRITGPDFTVVATPSTVTASPGKSVGVALLITPMNGFDQIPALSCSGLPSGSTCSFGAPAKQADGSSVVSMTIHTASQVAASHHESSRRIPFFLAFLPFVLWISSKRLKQYRKVLYLPPLILGLVTLGVASIGCAGKASPSTVQSSSTGSQTISVIVTAQTSTGITHTTTVSLKLM